MLTIPSDECNTKAPCTVRRINLKTEVLLRKRIKRFPSALRWRNLGTVHFLSARGGWWDLGGGAMRKKMAFEGGPSQKNKGKSGGHVKYFSKTLKWHNV